MRKSKLVTSVEPAVVKAQLFELLLGVIVLYLSLSGAFLYASGNNSSTLVFLLFTALLLTAGVAVLLLRLHSHSAQFMQHLQAQLPFEAVCSLRDRRATSANASELVGLLGSHVKDQQELLNAQFLQNVLGSGPTPALDKSAEEPLLSESEYTWQLLRAELQALEDQFNTDAEDDAH